MVSFVPYNPGSAVQEANKMTAALKDQGADLILMSQGAEESVPPFAREIMVSFSGGYRKATGGQMEQRETVAHFLNTYLGYGFANAQNTFLAFQNGRAGLGRAFKFAAAPFIEAGLQPAMMAGHLAWPMVASLARQEYLNAQFSYQLGTGDLPSAVQRETQESGLSKAGRNPALAALYTNYPNNPTGEAADENQIRGLQSYLNALNATRRKFITPPLLHIADNPYFASRKRIPGSDHALRSAYRGSLDPNQTGYDFIDTIAVTSFAKALALATPGVHAISFTNAKMAAAYEKQSKQNDGFSYFPEAMDAVVTMLHPDNYGSLTEHFDFLANKYERNYEIVKSKLGAHLLPGDPGMVCTIRVPKNALGKRITVNGEEFAVKTGRDVAAIAANLHNVVVVDQSTETPDGKHDPLLRLALKAEDESIIERGVDALEQTITDLQNAPALAA